VKVSTFLHQCAERDPPRGPVRRAGQPAPPAKFQRR
jgi:hypothetical protein